MSEFLGGAGCDALIEVIRLLSAGEPAAEAIEIFEQQCNTLTEDELSAVLQKLEWEGVPFHDSKAVGQLYHTTVMAKLLARQILQYPEGHPVRVYLQENQLLRELLGRLNRANPQQDFDAYRRIFDQVASVEKHYVRKENQLFPCLERHGWDSPSTHMWALHDEIREQIRTLRQALEHNSDPATLEEQAHAMQQQMLHLMNIEEQRLFPNALDLLEESEWVEMRTGDEEIGWMLDRTYPIYRGSAATEAPEAEPEPDPEEQDYVHPSKVEKPGKLHIDTRGMFHYDEGYLTPEQVNLMFKVLPLDITYVDEHDRVVFYNRGEERLFPRSANIIGREVRFCHPPKSVGTVLRILEEFRNGTKDVADFRIHAKGRYVLIRYFAVRDEQRNYRGVIEMSQDITDITTLEGEQRLLDWD